jgi:hypothetical protein
MGKGRIVTKKNLTKTMTDPYLVEIKGSPLDKVPLQKSREVKLEPHTRRSRRPDYGERHKVKSARSNPDTGGLLDRGIQLHRHWFQFLKLGLELEHLGVNLIVTKQTRVIKSAGGGAGNLKFRLKDTVPLNIKKNKYEGWDLDEVLRDPFDKWWKTHSHLFEGHPPSFTTPNDNHDPNDFLFIRLDKSSNLQDVRDFITEEVKDRLTGKPKFQIDGYPRPDNIQNSYNALVLSLKDWTAQEICEHKNIYLRATDIRSGGERLKVGVSSKGKKQYSALVSKHRNVGIHHLLNVMNGKFGDLPDKGIG